MTNTKRINHNLLRKETSFVCYTSSVLRKSRHMKQKEKITHCCWDQNSRLQKLSTITTPPLNTATTLFNEPDGNELLLEIFSMEKLNSLLYRNCSVNFFTELLHFTLPPELTQVGMLNFFRCTLRSVVKHVIVWDRNHDKRGEYILSIRGAEWPLRSGSGQNFKTRVSGSWEKKPGKTRFFFGFWNECDFER